eukprot:TRINITY_DN35325_c0_g1_i1.p1 TRINITY_DN35325_c0_g1~~TRINITY_DN35325_c0_g1_i1.p1  ORF type:complete len:112 (+),score=26.10 TRINITY_DN35325_c0_g1_i1:13-348(+)
MEVIMSEKGAHKEEDIKYITEERDMFKTKCEKLSEIVDALSIPNTSKSIQYLYNMNRLHEAEIKDLKTELLQTEDFKKEVLETVRHLRHQIELLTEELLNTESDAVDLYLP